MARFVVNGRFLGVTPPTGIQRVARSFLIAAKATFGDDMTVVVPRRIDDPLADIQAGLWRGPLSGLAWEQIHLPMMSRGAVTVSLANTGPVVAGTAALLVHDLAPLTNPEWFHRRMQIYSRISLAAARRADVVFAVSGTVANALERRGVSSDRLRVVHPGIDDFFTPAPDSEVVRTCARLGILAPYIVHVGSHDPRKNVAEAIRAHLAANASTPHQLVLVGSPQPNLTYVSQAPNPSNIWTGRLDDTALRAVLTGAHALVYPSFDEGFGLPPLEAHACGTPSIVSDIPALRESAGRFATFVRLGDHDGWTSAICAAVRGDLTVAADPDESARDSKREFVEALRALA